MLVPVKQLPGFTGSALPNSINLSRNYVFISRDDQTVYFEEGNEAAVLAGCRHTELDTFFELNKSLQEKNMPINDMPMYVEVPETYTWESQVKDLEGACKQKNCAVGRIHTVPHAAGKHLLPKDVAETMSTAMARLTSPTCSHCLRDSVRPTNKSVSSWTYSRMTVNGLRLFPRVP